jgi:hypothetical protein
MLPDSAFPGALPLKREVALELLDRPEHCAAAGGTFLTFVMIPLEERVGEYRFAGASHSLADAFRRAEDFGDAMNLHQPGRPRRMLRTLLEDNTGAGHDGEYSYPHEAPLDVGMPHRLVLCVQYGAPYDDTGVCVVEIPALDGSPYDGRKPGTAFPPEWREPLIEWVLDQGADRFGSAPTAVEAAIRGEERPDVWSGWPKRLADSDSWEELLAGPEGRGVG